jgi:DNA-binding beta-propeller fold protein YncE
LSLRRALLALTFLAAIAAPSAASAATSLYVSSLNAGKVSQFDIGAGGLLAPKSPAAVTSSAANASESLAITPDGSSLYLSDLSGKVAQFDIGATGLLTPKSAPTVTTPSGGGGRIAISPEGNSLYVPLGATIAQFDIGAGGLLSPKSPASVGNPGFSAIALAVSPDGSTLYSSGVPGLNRFPIGAGGRLGTAVPIAGGGGVWLSMRPDGRSLYASQLSAAGIRQYDVGPTGELTPKSPATVATGTETAQLAVSADGNSLYAADFNHNGVAQFDIAADGKLTPKTPATVAGGAKPAGVAVTPSGGSVYLGNFGGLVGGGTTISQYAVGGGGTLAALAPATAPAAEGPWWMFARPDQGPVASITVKRAAAGSPVFFNGSASHDPDGTVKRYDWDFGDGFTATNAGPTPSHTFKRGTFQVTLTAIDDEGCSNRIVFTGQVALCNGTGAATKTSSIIVPKAFRGVTVGKSAKVKGGSLRVKVGCPKGIEGPCKGKLVLKGIGKAKIKIAAGKSKRLKLALPRRKLTLLERAGKLVAKATATAHDGFGVKRITRAKITLKL